MTIRSLTVAAVAVFAVAACQKPADTPAVIDTTTPANATPTIAPVDSGLKVDSTATKSDSAKPVADSATPAK